MAKIGRHDACPCGSGKKYKRCCLAKVEKAERQALAAAAATPPPNHFDFCDDCYDEAPAAQPNPAPFSPTCAARRPSFKHLTFL
jgi:hypothetical protein